MTTPTLLLPGTPIVIEEPALLLETPLLPLNPLLPLLKELVTLPTIELIRLEIEEVMGEELLAAQKL